MLLYATWRFNLDFSRLPDVLVNIWYRSRRSGSARKCRIRFLTSKACFGIFLQFILLLGPRKHFEKGLATLLEKSSSFAKLLGSVSPFLKNRPEVHFLRTHCYFVYKDLVWTARHSFLAQNTCRLGKLVGFWTKHIWASVGRLNTLVLIEQKTFVWIV